MVYEKNIREKCLFFGAATFCTYFKKLGLFKKSFFQKYNKTQLLKIFRGYIAIS